MSYINNKIYGQFGDYRYMATIDIANIATTVGYQHRLNLLRLPGMASDFSDLNFCTMQGDICDFYTESQTTPTKCICWIKPRTGLHNKLLLFWGKSQYTKSDGKNTFIFFDNMLSNNLSLYTVDVGAFTWNSDGYYFPSYATGGWEALYPTGLTAQDIVGEVQFYLENVTLTNEQPSIVTRLAPAGDDSYTHRFIYSSGYMYEVIYENTDWYTSTDRVHSGAYTISKQVWYKQIGKAVGSNLTATLKDGDDGTLLTCSTTDNSYSGALNFGFGAYIGEFPGGKLRFKNFFVRIGLDTEPTLTINWWGKNPYYHKSMTGLLA